MVRETELSSQFGLEIYSVHPMKGVYLIKTDKGSKCLKKVAYGPQKLMYIYMAKEHVVSRGFDRIDRNVLTLEGLPYAVVNEDIYVLTDWIDGRECDYKNEEDLKTSAKTLAEFHKYANGFEPEEELRARNDIGKLPSILEKRMSTLNKMRDMARKNKRKTEFDMIYLSNVEFYLKAAKKAVGNIDNESFERLCDISLRDKVLCHHDFTYHNILIDKNEKPHVIDFDYFKSEVQIFDLATFVLKSLKRLEWDKEQAKKIIEAYNEEREISYDEYKILKVLMLFPQRFWRLSNRYYYKEASWGEESFTKKMRDIIGEKEKYSEYLENVEDIFQGLV